MLLGKKRKLGRKMEEITVGEKLSMTEKVEDKDILLIFRINRRCEPSLYST